MDFRPPIMKKKIENKIDKKTGAFLCGGTGDKGCGKPVGLSVLIKGIASHSKCADILKGIRDNKGILIKEKK